MFRYWLKTSRRRTRRLDPVFGWQLVLPTVLRSNFLPFTGASRLSPAQCFGETLPTFRKLH
ncbi:MAG: hypothetical protein LBG58_15910 [Planctomycetaceae bacterium]|jgi:hypothetical protein|nr:hypothetical protein [Planctomycetaceae bacterium]